MHIVCIATMSLVVALFVDSAHSGDTASGLTLSDCLTIALKENPDIKIARSRVDEVRARRNGVIAKFLPRIDLGLSYYRRGERNAPPSKAYQLPPQNEYQAAQQYINNRFDANVKKPSDEYYAELLMNQPLFQGGKEWGQLKSVIALLRSEEQRLDLAVRTVKLSVTRLFYELLRTQLEYDIQRDLLEKLKEQHRIARLLYEGGKNSYVDVLKIQTQLAGAEDSMQYLQNSIVRGRLSLARSMGMDRPVDIARQLPAVEKNISINTECLKNGISDNPEILYALQTVEKLRYDELTACGGHLPTLSLKGGYSLGGYTSIKDNRFPPRYPNWYFGAAITIPIFQGNGVNAEIAEAKAKKEQAIDRLKDVRLELAVRFQTAESALRDSVNRLNTTEQILQYSRETLTASELKYNAGKLSAFELLDAQTVWINARLNYTRNIVNYRITAAELEYICPGSVRAAAKEGDVK